MEYFEPIHHFISLGKHEESLIFTIDFEVVEIGYPSDLVIDLDELSPVEFWQKIFDMACDALGKERRQVFAARVNSSMPPFTEGIWEYIRHSNGFVWVYFSVSKPAFWPRFYNHIEVVASNEKRKPIANEIRQHFKSVIHYAARQGITQRHSVTEPDETVFRKLTQLLSNKKINGKP